MDNYIDKLWEKYSVRLDLSELYNKGMGKTIYSLQIFKNEYFKKAIEEAMQAQREACANAWHDKNIELELPYYDSLYNSIINAKVVE